MSSAQMSRKVVITNLHHLGGYFEYMHAQLMSMRMRDEPPTLQNGQPMIKKICLVIRQKSEYLQRPVLLNVPG